MRTDMTYRKKAVSEKEKKRIVKHFLTDRLGLTDEGLRERLEERAELIDLKKGELYAREGENCNRVSFLLEGAAMGWRQETDGRM
jgi:CRP-like cAMP-binding protein